MTANIDIAARHRTVTAVLRKYRGFAKLAKWRGQAMSYRETHDVIEFTTEQNANGDFTDETRRAAEARATELCNILRAHGLTVNWNGSYAYSIEVKLDAPLIDVASEAAIDDTEPAPAPSINIAAAREQITKYMESARDQYAYAHHLAVRACGKPTKSYPNTKPAVRVDARKQDLRNARVMLGAALDSMACVRAISALLYTDAATLHWYALPEDARRGRLDTGTAEYSVICEGGRVEWRDLANHR